MIHFMYESYYFDSDQCFIIYHSSIKKNDLMDNYCPIFTKNNSNDND